MCAFVLGDEEMLQDTKQEMKSMEEARLEQAIAVKQAIIEHLERNVEDLQQVRRTFPFFTMSLSNLVKKINVIVLHSNFKH